jgi:hypothetical protein
VHDAKVGFEERIKERRLAGGLGAEDGYDMVVEAGVGNLGEL